MNKYVKPQLVAMTREELLRELDRKVASGQITAADRDRVVRELDASERHASQ